MVTDYVNRIKYSTYVLDKNLKIVQVDDVFPMITGYSREDVEQLELGQVDLIVEEDREYYFSMVQENLKETGEVYLEHRIRCKNGTTIFVFCLGYVQKDEKTGDEISVIRVTDMTTLNSVKLQAETIRSETRERVEDLMEKAATDELTGLLRRGAFIKQVSRQIASRANFSLLMLDLDDFKQINDIYGHSVGDDVLIQVAEVFKDTLRGRDAICRMGGDEFAIMLTNVNSDTQVLEVIGRITTKVRQLPVALDKGFTVQMSIGVKLCDVFDERVTFEKLYLESDAALYQAKKLGKNQFVIV